jgi:acetate kinase
VLDGRSVDNSMGFTPLEGLMMGTRAGSVDPGLLFHLQAQRGLTAADIEDALTHRSGLLGVSGVASDMRQVLEAADSGNANAKLAYDMFVLYARRGVGAAAGVLGGADALVFTGGVGEHQPRVRREISVALPDVRIDDSVNAGDPEGPISAPGSAAKVLVVRAREDLILLREVRRLDGGVRRA